jgi:cytochrome P450
MSGKADSRPLTTESKCPVTHIGSGFDPFDGDPYDFYTTARREEPIFYNPQLGYWVVTRYNDVRQIFLDSATFSAAVALELFKPLCPAAAQVVVESGLKVSPSMVDQDPPAHTRYRKLWRKPFTLEEISKLEPRIRALVTRHIDGFVKRGQTDLIGDFMFEVPALVIFSLLGIQDQELENVRKFAKRSSEFGFGQPSDERQVELAENMAQYWVYAKSHVDGLIEHPGNDLMSEFIKELRKPENEDLWSLDYLYTVMHQFLFAGHETTTNAAAGAFRALLTNREQWEALVADPSLIPNAVEESLRFYTPVPHWRRITTKEVRIGGVDLPAGARLLIALASADRDNEKFDNGDTFDIRRPDADEHLAFGWGRHLCLGEALARFEMRIALEELSRRLPHMFLVPGQHWEYSPNVCHRGPEHVLVTWAPSANPIPEDRK